MFVTVWTVALGALLVVVGWFCIFRTDVIVAMGRRGYEKSKSIGEYPLSDLVLKDSYPTFIRRVGIITWALLFVALCLAILAHFL